jgi:cytochrome b pre-mRNA-processing protein 3
LNPLKRLIGRRFRTSSSEKLYGAIVAQARLPVFYRSARIPDTLEGRFGVLALNLFAVLHSLAGKGDEGRELAQDLADRFTRDMETVLREQGVGDTVIPKTMRKLAGSSRALLQHYEEAFANGRLAEAIAASLPLAPDDLALSSERLASYVTASISAIERQTVTALAEGEVDFAEMPEDA